MVGGSHEGIASLVFMLVMFVSPVGAQLLVNSTFESSVEDWEEPWDGTMVWDPLDVANSSSSGSCLVTNLGGNSGNATGPHQCVTGIVGGKEYLIEASVFHPGGQTETGWTRVFVRWYQDICFGNQVLNSTTPISYAPDEWSKTRLFVEAPASAIIAAVRLDVWKVEAGGSLSAHFDNVILEEVLFRDGFETGELGSWTVQTLP